MSAKSPSGERIFAMEQAINALEGIFIALEWIEDEALKDWVEDRSIANARAGLVLAGLQITRATSERF